MSKFGLMEDPDESVESSTSTTLFSEKLASFPKAAPKHRIDIAAMDEAAAVHGFISREVPHAPATPYPPTGRRRRVVPVEPTRHLAIRLAASQYERFVAYADKYKLTYHDALAQLLDRDYREP